MWTLLTIILKTFCILISILAFILETPFRIISAVFLLTLFLIIILTAPLKCWKSVDVTTFAEWTFLCKHSLANKVYHSYAKALGV